MAGRRGRGRLIIGLALACMGVAAMSPAAYAVDVAVVTPDSEPTPDPVPDGPTPEPVPDVDPVAQAPVDAPVVVETFAVVVRATPRDAAIIVGGERVGTGSATIRWRADEKAPRVRVRRRGFKAQRVRLRVGDHEGTRHVRLAPDYQLDLE